MPTVKNIPDYDECAGFYAYSTRGHSDIYENGRLVEEANMFRVPTETSRAEFVRNNRGFRGVDIRMSLRAITDLHRDVFDWSVIETSMDRVCHVDGNRTKPLNGKKVSLEIMTTMHLGQSEGLRVLPKYMTTAVGTTGYNPLFEGGHIGNTTANSGAKKWLTRVWLPKVAEEIARIIAAIGARYNNDPRFGGIGYTEFPGLAQDSQYDWAPGDTRPTSASVYASADLLLGALADAFPNKPCGLFANHLNRMTADQWRALAAKYLDGRGLYIGAPDVAQCDYDYYNKCNGSAENITIPETDFGLRFLYDGSGYIGKVPQVWAIQRPTSRCRFTGHTPAQHAEWVINLATNKFRCYQLRVEPNEWSASSPCDPSFGMTAHVAPIANARNGRLWTGADGKPGLPSLISRESDVVPGFPAPTDLAVSSNTLTWAFSDQRGTGFRVLGGTKPQRLGPDQRSIPLSSLGLAAGTHTLSVNAIGANRAAGPSATISVAVAAPIAPTQVCVVQGASPKITWTYTPGAAALVGFEIMNGSTRIGRAGPHARELAVALPTGSHTISVRALFAAVSASTSVSVAVADPVVPGTTCT